MSENDGATESTKELLRLKHLTKEAEEYFATLEQSSEERARFRLLDHLILNEDNSTIDYITFILPMDVEKYTCIKRHRRAIDLYLEELARANV